MRSTGSSGRRATFHRRFARRISVALRRPMLRRSRHGRTRGPEEGRAQGPPDALGIWRGRERKGRGWAAADSVGGERR